MQGLRNILIGAILVVTFLLFIEWNEFSEKKKLAQSENTSSSPTATQFSGDDSINKTANSESLPLVEEAVSNVNNNSVSDDIPSIASEKPTEQTRPTQQAKLVSVTTDNFEIIIDTFGGDIVQSSLLKHDAKLNEPDNHFILLNRNNAHTYVAQSGLIGKNGTDKGNQSRPTFNVQKNNYLLADGQDELFVDLNLQENNVTITKRFRFSRDSYLIDIEYIIDNNSSQNWSAAMYGQIRRDSHVPESDTGIGMKPFTGAATTTPNKNYKKMDFDDIEDESFKVSQQGGWIAMVQHYFVSAWIPNKESANNYQIRKLSGKDVYLFEYSGNVINVEPNTQGTIKSSFYTGPKDLDKLEEISPYLDLTLDYSFLWFIAKPLFQALDFIHSLVGNWGIAIILLTVLIKAVFFYPSAISYRSMAKMRKLSPMMAELKERYGDDRQKMSSELMGLYRKEKVNPLGGCLPILLQMPVFISLYWVIMESVELRHSPFYFWIQDLSIKDPFFVLPIIMGVTMFIQQKLNPTPPDPMQAKVMQMMPIFFTFLFMFFPAGLVLYWVVNNTLSIAQQYFITKQIENAS